MKCNTAKLSVECDVTPFKFDLLLLVMQLVILCKDLSSQTTSTRVDHQDKLPYLNNSIQCQLVQLNAKTSVKSSPTLDAAAYEAQRKIRLWIRPPGVWE
jgi:hypothetical protein